MELSDTRRSRGYGKPPWKFTGSALYQLHLVKAETARAFIPKEFRLVEAFGYTLGGFFLASYDDSPAGVFDELVVIAGIVWNPPTSCAWAAKVLVNSYEACDHGRKDVGLPSQVARFSKRITPVSRRPENQRNGLLNVLSVGAYSPKDQMDLQVSEINDHSALDVCRINLTTIVPALKVDKWSSPVIRMSLPSFSGRTEYNPNLLKYSCQIECRVRLVRPAKVSMLSHALRDDNDQTSRSRGSDPLDLMSEEFMANVQDPSVLVMLSKPILALEFRSLKMHVEAPILVTW
ncbi:protein NEOXANTHIN-DEFICIENT 1 [Rhodamnia argentea]|uniref:Protein NEOXANTHIN-DEFICIENT 1 n=1 Tax=Rhodamnia argentea TaxID=178133 RepID=A0A8B8Q4E7_9MYRT|nr:protein NEOXANTHIN-DEFICIENT 1 [Rhodamnia argentea]XP_048136563.1 protein NEOXANTHIN-DEFICIENT 1 [Rhodamnia argentea]XP_048136564.1 protein NEOXANTHIN-DEFICIENT 1 [Rhodamnia argentea]XP_048136565.1 protein NEOXANTHIN-DEFICIENT 1 [Rhodamnia argentea]XP_048136566.1 protein NEOXANTHIN-DEFICIENT 1 [Rhodamnia argentea]XP_048136567.1 protein NEOXANTHIN-DEFICIENT 1 [Rhodamnia argentea]